LLGENPELGEIDGVGAFAQDLALRTFLDAALQEGAHVLEIVGLRVRGQGLRGRERPPVTGEDVADFSLRDGHQRGGVHAVLERKEEMEAAAQDVGLKSRLALQGNEAVVDRPFQAPQFLHDANARVRDVAQHPRDPHEDQYCHQRAESDRSVHGERRFEHGQSLLAAPSLTQPRKLGSGL
jgi:hypothetical protein